MNDNSQRKNRKILEKKAGRPTVITEDVIAKLEAVKKLGVSNEIACDYANIHPATYYRHLESDEDFARRMRSAEYFANIAARQAVVKAIVEDKDVKAAQWWLERRDKDFSGQPQQVVQQVNIIQQLKEKYVED